VRKKQIENQILSSFGWKMEDFLRAGRKHLPLSHFSSLVTEIQNFDLGCQFILAGFREEKSEEPEIFVIENPGVDTPRDMVGFACIGAGTSNAEAYLTWREQGRHEDLWETVYNGIAAKALSEKAIGVGRQTEVVIVPNAKKHEFLHERTIEGIRKIWEEEECHYRPEKLKERVETIIKWR
jgi:20S proteasome alpha/beta subunit